MMDRIDKYGEYVVTPAYVREIFGRRPTQEEIDYHYPDGTITETNKDTVDLDQLMDDADEITLVQIASYKYERGWVRAYKGEGCTCVLLRARRKKQKS